MLSQWVWGLVDFNPESHECAVMKRGVEEQGRRMPGVVGQGWLWLRGGGAHGCTAEHPRSGADTSLGDSGRSSHPGDADTGLSVVNVKSERRVMLPGNGSVGEAPVSSREHARCPHRARLPKRHIQRGRAEDRGRSAAPSSHTPDPRRSAPLTAILSSRAPSAPRRSPSLALSLLLLCLALPGAAAQNATICGLNSELGRGTGAILRCVCRPGFFNTSSVCR